MWKSLFTFVCGIIAVSSLNVSPQKNETVGQTKNSDHIIYWNTHIFPLAEMDHDKYHDFVVNISRLMRAVERNAVEVVDRLSAENTKIVENYTETTNRRVLDSEKKIYLEVHEILDPIEKSRPLSVTCWTIYNSFVTAGGAVKDAAENCRQHFINLLARVSRSIMQILKDKNREILEECTQISYCQGEDCQKSAEYAILNVTGAAKKFVANFESIIEFGLKPEPQLNRCVGSAEDSYVVERDTVVENTRYCEHIFGF